MSQVKLLPRLPVTSVRQILERHSPAHPPEMDERGLGLSPPDGMWYAATGGTRSPASAFEIASQLRKIAAMCGSSNVANRSTFDQDAAIFLATHDALQGGEALRDDVWAFLTTVVAPDVVAWRFPDLPGRRFEGGVRNAFQRLWLRARALDRGENHADRWELVRAMPEDAVVAIIERTSIAARHSVSLALAEGWLKMARAATPGSREDVMRLATKLLLLESQLIDLAALSDDDLAHTVADAFQQAIGKVTAPISAAANLASAPLPRPQVTPSPAVTTQSYKFAKFKPGNVDKAPDDVKVGSMAYTILQITKVEGPIHRDEITARVMDLWGLQGTDNAPVAAVGRAINVLLKKGQVVDESEWYSLPGQPVAVRSRANLTSQTLRDPGLLPPQEIREAIRLAVQGQIREASRLAVQGQPAMCRANLAPDVASMFGFPSTDEKLRGRIEAEIDQMIASHILSVGETSSSAAQKHHSAKGFEDADQARAAARS